MGRIEDCLSFTVGKAYQQVQQEAKRRLAPFGVTPSQFALLAVLWEHDGQSAAALGERLVFDSATMTGLVDRLSRDGFVKRRPHPDDRRINLVWLTRAGSALEAPLESAIDLMHADFAERLGARDLDALLSRLRRATERLAGGTADKPVSAAPAAVRRSVSRR